MNIIQAIRDENLIRPFLGDDLGTWRNWLAALRVVYGRPVNSPRRRRVVKRCTGRPADSMPEEGFDTALFLTGRRSGKSRVAAIIGAYEAILAGHEHKLAKGERGVVAICAPTKSQARIVQGYLRAIFETPMLRDEVVRETREGFDLQNGNSIEVLAGDYRTIRGFTLIAAIVDEAAFFGYDAESKVKSDTELVRAIQPSLATVAGKLVCISSPYARRGWCYNQFQRNFGNDTGRVLVWNCPSRTMNPTLSQSIVDDALADDLQAAKSEYLGEFRDDVAEFLTRAVIERLVVKGRTQLMPESERRYFAFADMSGGRSDDAALAVAHDADRTVVVDLLIRYRPPFNPHDVVREMVEEVKRYGIRRIQGDNYAADFVSRAFEGCGLRYSAAEKNKSQLYLELLPRMLSGEIELPDNEPLIRQLASLERRTRSGGRDIVDHPPRGHDDLANVVAGVAFLTCGRRTRRAGALFTESQGVQAW